MNETILIKAFYLPTELKHETLVQLIQTEFPQLNLKSHHHSLSKNQKYQVSSLEIDLVCEGDIQALYRNLTQNPYIKMVL